MSFVVLLAKRAAAQVKTWHPEVQEQVIEALDRLSEKPSLAKPIRTGPLKGMMGYEIRAKRLPLTESITAVFWYYQDEVHLGVFRFVLTRGDPPSSLPPTGLVG